MEKFEEFILTLYAFAIVSFLIWLKNRYEEIQRDKQKIQDMIKTRYDSKIAFGHQYILICFNMENVNDTYFQDLYYRIESIRRQADQFENQEFAIDPVKMEGTDKEMKFRIRNFESGYLYCYRKESKKSFQRRKSKWSLAKKIYQTFFECYDNNNLKTKTILIQDQLINSQIDYNFGIDFSNFHQNPILRSDFKGCSEVNILVMGGTKVGKSAFINTFKSFFEGMFVEIAKSEHNEHFAVTLGPQIYEINYDSQQQVDERILRINFIDAKGIENHQNGVSDNYTSAEFDQLIRGEIDGVPKIDSVIYITKYGEFEQQSSVTRFNEFRRAIQKSDIKITLCIGQVDTVEEQSSQGQEYHKIIEQFSHTLYDYYDQHVQPQWKNEYFYFKNIIGKKQENQLQKDVYKNHCQKILLQILPSCISVRNTRAGLQ